MRDIRAKWLTFYAEHLELAAKEIFGYVERMIIGTLIISAGAHVSSSEPAIVLFGYLRHGLGYRTVRDHTPCPEFPRRLLQACKAGLACRVPDRDDAVLLRPVRPVSPVDPRLSRRVADDNRPNRYAV